MAKYKREMIVFLDTGVCGTLVDIDTRSNQMGFATITYVPLNSFPPKPTVYPKTVNLDHLHHVASTQRFRGGQDRICFVYTNEDNSMMKNIFDGQMVEALKKAKQRIVQLETQVASLRQSEDEATTNVQKKLLKAREITGRRTEIEDSPASPFDRSSFRRFDNEY